MPVAGRCPGIVPSSACLTKGVPTRAVGAGKGDYGGTEALAVTSRGCQPAPDARRSPRRGSPGQGPG